MTQKFDSGIHDLAVCKYSNFCFVYHFYTYWNLVDAWVRKDEQLFKNVTGTSNNIFYLLNIRPFLPGGFFTFLAVVAHGAALSKK